MPSTDLQKQNLVHPVLTDHYCCECCWINHSNDWRIRSFKIDKIPCSVRYQLAYLLSYYETRAVTLSPCILLHTANIRLQLGSNDTLSQINIPLRSLSSQSRATSNQSAVPLRASERSSSRRSSFSSACSSEPELAFRAAETATETVDLAERPAEEGSSPQNNYHKTFEHEFRGEKATRARTNQSERVNRQTLAST